MVKKIILFCIIICGVFSMNAQTVQENIEWKIFASGKYIVETFEINQPSQDFIDVKQEGNKFIWGKDNIYKVYNKKVSHSGFMSYTIWDFIDKYNQKGQMIYQNNRDADWATKHMFYIHYKGQEQGKYYCSNEPKNIE